MVPFVCLAAHEMKPPRWTPAVKVKLLLPPRQSRGTSYRGLVAPLSGQASRRASGLRCRAMCLLMTFVCLGNGGCALSGSEIEAIQRAEAPAPSLVQTTVAAEFR